jgi:hypothetical protein
MGRPFVPTETKAYVKNTHAWATTRTNEDVFGQLTKKTCLIDQPIQLLSRMAKHINATLVILIIHGRRYHLAAIVSHVSLQIRRLRNGDADNHVT